MGQRRFLPLFITQFMGAFNDNLYKAGLLALFTYTTLVAEDRESLYANLATLLLSSPFFLFSSTAGTLADYYEKSRLIQYVKIGELLIAVLIVVAFITRTPWFMLVVIFLLGTQSAFFGPLKFSIIPQHLKETELVGGNALIGGGTLVAILLGTILGTAMARHGNVSELHGTVDGAASGNGGFFTWINELRETVPFELAILIMIVAIVGLISSYRIPKAPSHYQGTPKWNPIMETFRLFVIASERKAVFQSVFGVSWFWTLGAVYLTQLPKLTESYLFGKPEVYVFLLCLVTLAIAFGSVACELLSRKRVEMGLVPIGAIFVSVIGLDFYFAVTAVSTMGGEGLRTLGQFFSEWTSYRILLDLFIIGFALGLYFVPLQSLIQARTPVDRRARVIAANNILNAAIIAVGIMFSLLWIEVIGWNLPTLLLFFTCFNAVVSIYIFLQVPEFTLRFVVWILSHSLYRVRHQGIDLVPERGGALIVCNHVSYIDALVLAGAVRRPIRFVMSKDVYETRVMNYLFKACRTIPITPKKADPDAYEEAFGEIQEALENGDLLCIFPEGRLTPDGEIKEFRSGVLKILESSPVPVIPAALRGLWGSKFTHHGDGLWKGSMKLWSKLEVALAEPVEAEDVELSKLQYRVMTLRGALQ